MQPELEVKTPSLTASTELLVMAPIRRGFVPSLDTISYKSRTKLLLKILHAGRQSQHEYRPMRAMSDAVERVGVIRSLRVAVIEGSSDIDDRILLSVHFDGSYEAYVRTIWQRAARLLDLIFCNSEGYVTGWDHPFDDWNAWIRSVQVITPFFYATPGITYLDQTYLQMLERRDRGGAVDELKRTRIAVPTAEEVAWSIVVGQVDPTKRADNTRAVGPMARTEVFRQNLSALAGIYRLADWYRPGTADGEVLRHAAHELLPQLRDMFLSDPNGLGAAAGGIGGDRLAKSLGWFVEGLESVPPARAGTALPEGPPSPLPEGDVQGGILTPYEGVTDAVMVLVAFDGSAGAATLLEGMSTTSAISSDTPADQVLVNLALTHEGLRACGLTQAELDKWPLEFRQGMAARAGLLGDVRWNHPRRWTLPRYNGTLLPDPDRDDSALPPVPLESIHAIVQFRLRPASGSERSTARAVLASAVRGLGKAAGVGLLSVQWLARQFEGATVVDHFGYTDGQSQPELGRNPKATSLYSNQVHLGEVLVGYTNAADREEDQAINRDPQMRALTRNGSFLAVRKLRQQVAPFRAAVAAAHDRSGIDEKAIRAHMMGRWPADAGQDAGKPLAPLGDGGINDFSYRGDAEGDRTPLAAHIRRANPREVTEPHDYPKQTPGGRAPRIVRRSLPYGPRFDPAKPDNIDRGLVFMAYGASLAEQFEVIQGWLVGGNSSRSYSGASCPFLGVPEAGRERNFRFLGPDRETTVHMSVDGSDDLGTEPKPLVTLQWGLYAFAPSHTAQALLAKLARRAVVAATLPWSADRGAVLISHLRHIEDSEGAAAGALAWKAALEDPDSLARFDSASVWAAVRSLHGGVLRIPYGVLVAAPELVDAVLKDETRYTVDGYRRRLVAAGMGPIYLGRDASDPEYARQSEVCNRAIESISMEQAYREARGAARDLLSDWIRHAISVAEASGEPTWELALDSRDLIAGTLATLGERWFGLDNNTTDHAGQPFFQRGAMDWQWRPGDPVYYPGHFTASSRATFQAEPSPHVAELAAEHGTALTAALRKLIETKGVIAFDDAHVSREVLASFWSTDPDVAVRNIAGALMGLLPTTEGILRRVLPEWTQAGTLLELAARASGNDLDDWSIADGLLGEPLRRAIKFKPVPEQVWREAKAAHSLGASESGGEPIEQGEKLIVGQVSALHAQLERDDTADLYAAFGGRRGTGQPTHACPGYRAAIGAMIGLVSATLARSEGQLAQSTAPGVLVFRGRTPNPREIAIWRVPDLSLLAALPGQGKKLLAFGDSWMRFKDEDQATGGDFRRSLGALGYDTDEFDNVNYAYRGRTLAEMANYKPNDGKYVYGKLRELIKEGAPPLAVLVSGGGNDFVDGTSLFPRRDCARLAGLNSRLETTLKKQSESPQHSEQALEEFLADMKKHLTAIVSNLAAAGAGADGKQLVPIIVVAYDHPIPDGRAWQPAFTCPWLRPVFGRKEYTPPNGVGQGDSSSLMASFITRLNGAYGEVAEALAKDGILVKHVPLTGVLAKHQSANQLKYQDVWKNELHPTKIGFDVLAKHLHEVALQPLLTNTVVS